MSPLPLAIFGSINPLEILVVGVAALLIFGPRLPEVTLRLVAHVMRARRAVTKMWRETGLEDELRRVRRDIELSIPRDADFDIRSPVRKSVIRAADTSSTSNEVGDADDSHDPDADRAEEPFDSSVTIEPADDIIASGEWEPAIDQDSDSEAARREPEADPDTYADPAGQVQVAELAPEETPGEAPGENPDESSEPDVDAPKAAD